MTPTRRRPHATGMALTVCNASACHYHRKHLDAPFESEATRTLTGYKAQSEMVVDWIDNLISGCEQRKESLIVEGVHLNVRFVMRLFEKHPSVLPFLVRRANTYLA